MNVLSRKLYALESNVVKFPPDDDDIVLYVGNSDEQLLHDRAQKIRASFKQEVQAIVDSAMSPEQQNKAAKQVLNRLTDDENTVLDQSYDFLRYRLIRLIYNWFAAAYPKGEDPRVMLRVLWFFTEMQKFNHVCLIEDYAYEHNRNEDDPAFDDFAWWDALEAEKLKLYPEGVFTDRSYEAVEAQYDIHLAQKIREYYEAYPNKRAEFINSSKKALEAEKKNE